MPPEAPFVFFDPLGRRWHRLRILLLVATLLAFVISALFVRSLLVRPQLHIPNSVKQVKERLKELENDDSGPRTWGGKSSRAQWLAFSRSSAASNKVQKSFGYASIPERRSSDHRSILLGFYDDGDPAAFVSLQAHAEEITHVCSSWMSVVDVEGTIEARPDPRLKDFARKKGLVLLPMLDNSLGRERIPEAIEALAHAGKTLQEPFIQSLLGHLHAAGAGGVILDWGQIDPAYQDELSEFIIYMSQAMHEHGMELWLCVPMGLELSAFDLDTLAPHVDRFVAMLHDQNSETDPPGPLAAQEWFEGWLNTLVDYGEPSQWIVALGSYGYDWSTGSREAEMVSFHDVMSRASRAGIRQCKSTEPTYNPHFVYEEDGEQHEVWFLDVATFINQARSARKLEVGGLAISSLGFEDPAVWQAIKCVNEPDNNSSCLAGLQVLNSEGVVTHVGKGELLTLDDARSNGFRRFETDAAGLLNEYYETLPVYVTLSHHAAAGEDEVCLTFDDGPDPWWTPAILDILKQEGVKASFFVVGLKMENHPSLVRRIVQEGHEVGIHTYTHPNMSLVSAERAFLELNATQLLLQSLTGRSTVFFRPPFDADSRPTNGTQLNPILLAQHLGYLTVTENIDPEDWDRPGVDKILLRVKQQRRAGGNVILLHDAGGDRSQTVQALPAIIRYLKDRGDRIVSLSELMGESLDTTMPPRKVEGNKTLLIVSEGGFRLLHGIEEFLWSLMIVATILITVRTLTIVFLAFRNKMREKKGRGFSQPPYEPDVTVVVAAFNEEKVIGNTLRHLLNSAYGGNMEVVVVDDGSTDATSDVVNSIAKTDDRIRLIRQVNQGKARALQRGINAAHNDILIMLDADTNFERKTIGELVQPMRDPRVAAVSGRAMVGNPRTFIARCQSLEYISAFNLDRRAYHELECITVVPGAVSALRRSAVLSVGGISTDTLAEDTDLTLCLHKAGYKIVYAPRAVAWTEAPETIASLVKQRSRWAFGTLQCLWKHLDLMFNRRARAMGWFSIPSVWIFHVFLVALAPILDLTLITSMTFGAGGPIYFYFLAFMFVDLMLATAACLLEGEPLRQAWRMLPMRFLYRGLLSWVIWKSLIKAIKGAWLGWSKIERTASVLSRI